MTQRREINAWSDLTGLVELSVGGGWLFRGEARQFPSLQPKSGRVNDGRGSSRRLPYRLEDESQALDLFKRQARPYLHHAPHDDLEWLAIAQHHGVPTRLLDWTESPLIAAYFAAGGRGADDGARIYCVHGLPDADRTIGPFESTAVGVYRPPHISPRISAQSAVFTVHPDPTVNFAPSGLETWTVAKAACHKLKDALTASGISQASLFPDIDGLSRHVAWLYKWGKL